jgi:serine/threonine protein kinase
MNLMHCSVVCDAEVCLGLYVLHTNKILHRDIKAANIFVGENDCIKVFTYVCTLK